MKIYELIDYLKSIAILKVDEKTSCDNVKIGNPMEEIRAVGVCMFATPNVISEAKSKNINFLIVHEPLCYDHMDSVVPYDVGNEKKRLIDEAGITIFRFHDYAHSICPDIIYEGQMQKIAIAGTAEYGKHFAVNRYILKEEMTSVELAKLLEVRLNIKHIRIVGERSKKGKYISCCFGTPGHVIEELYETDFVLTGEICEWEVGEAARDLCQLGYNKSILVLGHIGSEREGMKLLTNRLKEKFADIQFDYIECGELYTYTDQD